MTNFFLHKNLCNIILGSQLSVYNYYLEPRNNKKNKKEELEMNTSLIVPIPNYNHDTFSNNMQNVLINSVNHALPR